VSTSFLHLTLACRRRRTASAALPLSAAPEAQRYRAKRSLASLARCKALSGQGEPPTRSASCVHGGAVETRCTRWAKRRQRILEAVGVTAPPAVLGQLRHGNGGCRGCARSRRPYDPTDRARRERSAGVLRPRHAGRAASKPVGGPRHSWAWTDGAEGRQLLRPGRGDPDTAPGWTRSSTRAHAPGKRRSPVPGHARWRRLGSLRTPSPRRWGKPPTRGRP
jgi:hypothetical protein